MSSCWCIVSTGGGAFTKPATDYNPLKAGDIIVVYGYVKNYKGTVEVCQDSGNKEWPTLFTWENSDDDKEVNDWLDEIEKNLTPDGGLTADYTAPNPVRPKTVTVELVITDGDTYAEVLDKTTLHIKEYPAEGSYTVKVTVKVTVGEKTSERSVTVTINPNKILSGSFTITSTSVKDFAGSYKEYTWSAEDANHNTIGGNLYAYPSDIQFNGGKDASFIASNVATPSPILSIEITGASGTATRQWKLFTSNKPYTETNKNPTSGTLIKVDSQDTFGVVANTTTTITVNEQDPDAYYFALVLTGTNASKLSSIKINYGAPLSDEEKVQAALDEIEIEQKEFSKDFELPTTSVNGVTLTWRVEDGGDAAKIDETKTKLLIVPQDTLVTFALVVTATCNDKFDSKRFEGLTVPEKGSEPTWTLVTSIDQLSAGAQIIFASVTSSGTYYCTDAIDSNSRLPGKLSEKVPDDVAIWTLGQEEAGWTFRTKNNTYLSQKNDSGTKGMALSSDVNTNSTWKLNYDTSKEAWKVTSGISNSRWFSFNTPSNPSFGTYMNTNISIYVLT